MTYAKFMPIVAAIAQLSKDPSTKAGALLLGPDREGGPWGYNGAPRGSRADEDERFADRTEKLHWAEHAERNAIYTAARTGFRTVGSTILVTHYPCIECARAIVQAGIIRVVVPHPDAAFLDRWKDSIARANRLFDECRVIVELVE